MTSSYQESLGDYYQLEEDAQAAGLTSVESQLIDFGTGVELVDGDTREQLTGETLEAQILINNGNCRPVLIANDESRPVIVNITNQGQSEVDTSLLGIPRSETALVLFDTVNIYGINDKEWSSSGGYTYASDPSDWTNRPDANGINYGNYARHLANESAIQAYSYPPPASFTYIVDDNSGRFPGGYTNGAMNTSWESKRAFRYQPGRVTGFTLGVRMSTGNNYNGEIIQWGCRNDYGDGYFFQLESGRDLFIVRTSPGLGTLKVARLDWNGDKLFVGEGATQWGLDLSRVTMFKIEFSWYGAVGAKFLAYVPVGHDEARWVTLHYISAENRFELPSLRSAYLRLFTSVATTAGTPRPAFINLYGSSVYIDGGDKGTVTTGAATLESPKNIDSNARSLIGLNIKGQINGVDNQKAVYPVSLSAFASVASRIDLIFRTNSACGGVQYGYGAGTVLSRGTSTVYSGSVTSPFVFTIASGQFPDISAELNGTTTYLSGKRVKINGTGVFATHATAINSGLTAITTDRALPPSLSAISLSRLNASAVGTTTVTSGTTAGTVFRKDAAGYWRLGLWPQASGVYNGTQPVVWLASSYPRLSFSSTTGQPNGETRLPSAFGCNEASSFTIATGVTSIVSAGGNSVTVTGVPWPVAVVAELMDGGSISNVVIAEGAFGTVGSGATKAISNFTLSGISQSTTAAGGSGYIAHKFEDALADPLSACLVDRQGSYVIPTDNKVATYFLGADETKTFSLDNVFGPDKMFITGAPGTPFNTGALFVMATARSGSGIASAMLNWEEQ
jgi:hypothetical protein